MTKLNLKSLEPEIIVLPETTLAAKSISMSFAGDQTRPLWKGFAPIIKDIPNKTDNDMYSVQIYPHADFFENFNPQKVFKKYAAVKVHEYDSSSQDLEELIIPKGQYALFHYVGKPSEAQETFKYILSQWITTSPYTLDNRPHIAKMGEKYKGEHPDSEEELLIPIC